MNRNSQLYIVSRSFEPTSAGNNRLLSFMRGLSEAQIKTSIIFTSPGSAMSVCEEDFPHIDIVYLWKKCYISHPKLKYISYLYYLFYLTLFLPRRSNVISFGFSELLDFLKFRKDLRVYYEISENPEISLTTNRYMGSSVDGFIKNCKWLAGLFVITTSLKEYFMEKGIPFQKIHIVNMTVDATRFACLIKNTNDRYIAYCGNASNNKDGVDRLIKSFADIADKHKDVRLYIIGGRPGDGESFANLELAKNLGLEDRVVFTGMVPPKDMPQLLKNAEICALDRPNNVQAKYGFPTKLGEYLLTENVAAITAVGDIPLFLSDKITALVSNPNDEAAFSKNLDWALNHREEAAEIGKRGAEVAMKHFNAHTETQKIIEAIGIKC